MRFINKKKLNSEVNLLLQYRGDLDVDSLEPFFADLIWDKDSYENSINNHLNLKQGCYLIFLIDVANTLKKFIIDPPEDYEENYYKSSNIYGYDPGSLFMINGIPFDGFLYFHIGSFCLENANGIAGIKPKAKYLNDVHLAIEGIKQDQEQLKNYPTCKNNICYIKETPKSILQKFLPCFIENIYDIPKDSILWQTPLLKETMSNYETLKQYAIEKGWLTNV